MIGSKQFFGQRVAITTSRSPHPGPGYPLGAEGEGVGIAFLLLRRLALREQIRHQIGEIFFRQLLGDTKK